MDVIANYATFWITLLLSCFVLRNNVMVVARSYAPTPSVAYAPSPSIIDPASTLNVIDYGAVGDGETDDSQAFVKAWNDICKGDRGDLVLFIPEGNTFLLNPTMFRGPCNSSPIQVKVQGSLIAPKTLEEWTDSKKSAWLEFANIQGLDISGSGQLDAQGSSWWNNTQGKHDRPTALRFHKCGDLRVQGLTHLNSAKNHITLNDCHDVDISYLQIRAPENSPNTDGIDISASTHVYIRDSIIGTGDDCIAINGGSSALNIINVTCGPGHGISIGSLGANGAYETVQDVLVKNCTMNGTSNGARIKTWEGGSGFASNITFEDIIVHESKHPIIIDQYYTNKQRKNKVAKNAKTAVNVTNVTYRNVHGTSASEFAIDLQCSEKVPCTNLVFEKINITSSIPGKQIKEQCENAHFNSASTLSFECEESVLRIPYIG